MASGDKYEFTADTTDLEEEVEQNTTDIVSATTLSAADCVEDLTRSSSTNSVAASGSEYLAKYTILANGWYAVSWRASIFANSNDGYAEIVKITIDSSEYKFNDSIVNRHYIGLQDWGGTESGNFCCSSETLILPLKKGQVVGLYFSNVSTSSITLQAGYVTGQDLLVQQLPWAYVE